MKVRTLRYGIGRVRSKYHLRILLEEESLRFQTTGLSNVSRLKTGGYLQMPVAFVLINTESGSEGEVLRSLRRIEGVKEAYSVYGVYDVVAKVEAKSMDGLKNIVTFKIRKLNMVRTTLTMIIIK